MRSDGRVRNVKRQTLLAPFVVSDKGYHVVALHLPPEGKKRPRKTMKVHRLRPIAETLAKTRIIGATFPKHLRFTRRTVATMAGLAKPLLLVPTLRVPGKSHEAPPLH